MRKITGLLTAAFVTVATTASADYGAIYFSQDTGAYGYSWNHRSQDAAEDAAYDACAEQARDCTMATWFSKACGALAIADGNGWGAGWGNSVRQAERKAIRTCREYDNSGCRIEISFCSEQ